MPADPPSRETDLSTWPRRIAVVGAGAMGSVFGGALAEARFETVLIDRRLDHIRAIGERGLTVDGVRGERHVRLSAVSDIEGLAPADLALVLVDSANTRAATETVRSVLSDDGYALTLQNGIGNAEILAEILGEERVLAGSTYTSAAFLEPGRVLHSNAGETVIGALDGTRSGPAVRFASILSEIGFATEAVENVLGHVWLKFVLNCALNPVCAATGYRPGEVLRDRNARALLDDVLGEIMAVIAAKGIVLPVEDPLGTVLEHGWVRYNRPSMLQHVEAGLVPEIAALNGALVEEADRLGVAVPVNRALSRMVLAIAERHRRRIDGPAIDEPALEQAAREDPDGWRKTD